jgi:hypothetical protein
MVKAVLLELSRAGTPSSDLAVPIVQARQRPPRRTLEQSCQPTEIPGFSLPSRDLEVTAPEFEWTVPSRSPTSPRSEDLSWVSCDKDTKDTNCCVEWERLQELDSASIRSSSSVLFHPLSKSALQGLKGFVHRLVVSTTFPNHASFIQRPDQRVTVVVSSQFYPTVRSHPVGDVRIALLKCTRHLPSPLASKPLHTSGRHRVC